MTAYPQELERVRALPLEPGLEVVGRAVWPGGRVESVTPILGGLGSAVDRVVVRCADGREARYVLRRQVPEWEGDVTVEGDVLDVLVAHDVPVPAARWRDPTGDVFGVAAILIDHAPGELVSTTRDPAAARRMGAALAAVHAVPRDAWPATLHVADGPLADRLRTRRERRLADGRMDDAFVDAAALWDAIETAVAEVDPGPLVLVHDDYHPGNVLDDGERVTIIDWGYPLAAYAGLDLGYATMDLSATGDGHLCAALLEGYASAAGALPPDLWFWQLLAVERSLPTPAVWLPAYRDQGHPDVTPEELERGVRALLDDALARGRAAGVLGTIGVRETTVERDA